jgi:hypothetical protein
MVEQEADGSAMFCATLAISLSSTKNHDFVPRGAADNKQTSASSITSCALVGRDRLGVPAALRCAVQDEQVSSHCSGPQTFGVLWKAERY